MCFTFVNTHAICTLTHQQTHTPTPQCAGERVIVKLHLHYMGTMTTTKIGKCGNIQTIAFSVCMSLCVFRCLAYTPIVGHTDTHTQHREEKSFLWKVILCAHCELARFVFVSPSPRPSSMSALSLSFSFPVCKSVRANVWVSRRERRNVGKYTNTYIRTDP